MKYASLLPPPMAVVPKATTRPSHPKLRLFLRLVRYPFAIALIATHALLAWLWSKA